MTFTPVVAPYVPSYANRQSYITPDEFTQDPNGVDVSQLVAGGNAFDNAAALEAIIADGSAWVDAICQQIIGATVDTQAGRYRIDRRGLLTVPCDYSPIVAIDAVTIGENPAALTPLTDSTGVWPNGKVVEIPVAALNSRPGTTGYDSYALFTGGYLYTTITYVNGYANTTLGAASAEGDTELTVASPLGIVAGMNLGLYDAARSEPVTVAAGYAYGSTTVPLSAPLGYAHDAGVACSALPPEVRRATKLLTAALIKTRGDEAFVMSAISSEPDTTALGEPGLSRDVDIATKLLTRFVRAR